MKKSIILSSLALATALISLSATAQGKKEMMMKAEVWKGYLVDKMCATGYVKSGDAEKASAKGSKHTKGCALEENCMESGYGLIIDGKYLKFDENGDKLAVDFLNKSSKKDNFFVEVSGTKNGETVTVKSIAEAKSEMMDMKSDKMKSDNMKSNKMKSDKMKSDKMN